jgi:hypothetical protein
MKDLHINTDSNRVAAVKENQVAGIQTKPAAWIAS